MRKFGLSFIFLLVAASAIFAQQRFVAALDGAQEVPANFSPGKGTCHIVLNAAQTQISVSCTYTGLGTTAVAAHIHGNAAPGANAGIIFDFGAVSGTSGTITPGPFTLSPAQLTALRSHLLYVNIHSSAIPGGEIRGQIKQVHTVSDIDGDGRSDAATFRQSTNTFWFLNSLHQTVTSFNLGTGTGDIFLNNTFDFDGDGRVDPLLLKLDAGGIATWTIYETGTNTVRTVRWGNFNVSVGDTLAMADYDGDGREDVAVFRRSTGDWWIIDSSTGAQRVEHWGTLNDFPSIGDYDGDGKADLTAVRVIGGQRVWFIRQSSNGAMRVETFGASATDGVFFFAPFDIDGDSKQDISVNRIVGGQRFFHVLRSSDGAYVVIRWGLNTDTALFGDYDGDGKTDLVARRISGGIFVWHILRSSDGQVMYINWGITNDQLTADEDLERWFVSTGPEL